MTPSDNVRKAAEQIFKLPCCRYTEKDWDGSLSRKAMAEIIESHCHVTEMEAVIEKAREALKLAQLEGRHFFKGSWVDKSMSEALASINALKGDGK